MNFLLNPLLGIVCAKGKGIDQSISGSVSSFLVFLEAASSAGKHYCTIIQYELTGPLLQCKHLLWYFPGDGTIFNFDQLLL